MRPGIVIPFATASINESLRRGSLEPVQGAATERTDDDWVDLLDLRGRRWVDVLVHTEGRPKGLMSFDWTGDELPLSKEAMVKLGVFGAVLGYQLSVTERLVFKGLQSDLDRFLQSARRASSPQELAKWALKGLDDSEAGMVSLSLFRYDWTRDELSRQVLLIHGPFDNPSTAPEVLPTGELLTGKAWRDPLYRWVRDFRELEQYRPDLVSRQSSQFHVSSIPSILSVRHERVGLRDKIWLIRAINGSQEPGRPLYGERDLFEDFAKYLSPHMDAAIAGQRSEAIAELQRLIPEDCPTDKIMASAAWRLRQVESIDRLLVVVVPTGVGGSRPSTYLWGDRGVRSVEDLARLVAHPSLQELKSNPRPLIVRRQASGILGHAAGLSAAEGADLLLVPARGAEFLGVLAIPVWNHPDRRMREGTFWTEPSEEFLTQVARLATSAVERRQSADLARNALRALSLVGHEMTEPLASAIGLSREALATVRRESTEGRAVPVSTVADWQRRFNTAAESLDAAQRLGGLVGRMHAGRLVGVRHEASAYRLLCQAGDRIDHERLVKGTLLQPREGIVFTPTRGELEATLACDAGLLRVAIENLLRNAVKYSFSTGGPSCIDTTIRTLADADLSRFLEIDVTNVGSHIPAPHQGAIFEPFTRYVDDGEAVARRGMGLGLYLASQIARGHQGTLKLTSHDPVGSSANGSRCFQTTFTLRVRADLGPGAYHVEL